MPSERSRGPISSSGSTWMSTAQLKNGFHHGNQPGLVLRVIADVEQEQPFVVFDQVGVDRQRLGPVPVEDHRQPTTPPRFAHVVARCDGRTRMVPVLTAWMVVAWAAPVGGNVSRLVGMSAGANESRPVADRQLSGDHRAGLSGSNRTRTTCAADASVAAGAVVLDGRAAVGGHVGDAASCLPARPGRA